LLLEGCHSISNKCLELFGHGGNGNCERFRKSLQVLNIRHCRKISCTGIKHLTALKNLQVLNIADNEKISNDSIKYIGNALHQLTSLNIRNNAKVTCSALKHLRQCKSLNMIDVSGIEKLQSLDFLFQDRERKYKRRRRDKKHLNMLRNQQKKSIRFRDDTSPNDYESSSSDNDSDFELSHSSGSDEDEHTPKKVRASFSNLCYLNMSENPITSDVISRYMDQIVSSQAFTSLKHLALNYCKQLSAALLGSIIAQCPVLTNLELCSTLTSDVTLQSLKCHDTLEYLDISFCKNITDACFKNVISRCTQLKYFYGKSLNQISMRHGWKHLFRNCKLLHTLTIPGCLCDDADLSERHFFEILMLKDTLTILDLSFSKESLTDGLLNEVLPHLQCLTWLDLTSCSKITALCILNSIVKLRLLSHLALSACPGINIEQVVNELATMHQLECLYLSGSNIDNEGLNILASGLYNLTDLSVMNCKKLQGPTCTRIISKGFPRLNALNLYELPVDDRGVFYLKQLRNLSRLRMSTSDQLFTEKGEQYLHEFENLVYFKSRSLNWM